MSKRTIPIVDLFAGPGGLGEGFSSLKDNNGSRVFDVRISIEKDPVAHQTLSLRSIFRSFPPDQVPDCYYDYIRGDITKAEFFANPSISSRLRAAFDEARNATLGDVPEKDVDHWIRNAIGNVEPWVLIGGPPCQAYSLAGRSRMRGRDPQAFEADNRHFLYKEYLRIIRKFEPAVFVMENVKGILSSTHGGSSIFERILDDLAKPGNGLEYDIRSFVTLGSGESISPNDFVIRSEKFGLPQMRHRVILFGIRRDLASRTHSIIQTSPADVSVLHAISDLPKLRSRLSKEPDSFEGWLGALAETSRTLKGWRIGLSTAIEERIRNATHEARKHESTGAIFMPGGAKKSVDMPAHLQAWYLDSRIGGVCLHEARSHMRSDLHRYLFASCFAKECGYSPKLAQFPKGLLPNHVNASDDNAPFSDRFKVQLEGMPSTTVVSHIAKDGHYYIHPDPSQCRSLTVREAARLQTFPDNYFFEGTRTQQYTQVGNAVPPYLAYQIAQVVYNFLT
jgi:DNA (cytosine-5)-methyltransferase 1